ncbi:hypothetical protein JJB99_26365 [Bradyrhizobium diazoefficiens]|uniref:hypothetical protein n=1 Tax=Bradyrhizobium diazoefficiens TaxID=1355477 RepID=UPI00190BF299|nr:hypothetical protein [Bradyrhizobium diazoefficiens]QQO12936.1 hypothetical protein JJB99_26365 [Bradyrhizobium diazoefficiens]
MADIERASMLARIGWRAGFGWDELLLSQRVIMVSEAGAGKTYECQTQQARLWNAGEPAFFLELATLSGSSVRDMLNHEEELRFDAWLRSQSETATFFLDSYDELKLTLGSFEQALKRLNKALAGQLSRARIIVTTRPVPIDRELFKEHLPIPLSREATQTAEAFADMMMERNQNKPSDGNEPKPWRNVSLMPLSVKQMREFAVLQGLTDPDALLADIGEREAQEFAERPQDLIELCSDWREHHRIRSHREQVESNVATKLKPRTAPKERVALSHEVAIEGASRLALAALLTRKLTLRHSADADNIHASEAALDISKVLLDWDAEAQSVLLERALFGFASYGRVRFHHRSVLEFLAAKRLDTLLARGVPIKSIKRLLFVETAQGTRTVRPTMRPVAAWLALWHSTILDDVLVLDPAVILNHGDPQSFSPVQRIRALEAYVGRYGRGGWRGLSIPEIQAHRFTCPELAASVKGLWEGEIENPEVRTFLLRIIAISKLKECADVVHTVAMDAAGDIRERTLAIEAMVQLSDDRLERLVTSLEMEPDRWPGVMARRALIELFPGHVSVDQLSKILRRVKEHPRSIGELTHRLPHEIETADLSPEYLDALRQSFTALILDGITWDQNKFPHLRTKRYDLIPALRAACRLQEVEGVRSDAWIASSLLAIRLWKEEYSTERDAFVSLRLALDGLPLDARERAFWAESGFVASLHKIESAWGRIFDLSYHGGIQLNDKDDAWIRQCLVDQQAPIDHREMMLYAELNLLNRGATNYYELLEGLKPLVADSPDLTAIIDNRMKPQEISAEIRCMEVENAKRMKQAKRRAAKDHASWVIFWREVAHNPDAVFSGDRAEGTALDLWRAIGRSGEKSRASGWNRRFIEAQFGKSVADRLRETMMAAWRKERPTLRSERAENKKDTFLVRWQFGLASVAAEAEDPNWAQKLTEQEAELACRFAPIEMNALPSWLESLTVEYPQAVDHVLGQELSLALQEITNAGAYSIFLQHVAHAPAIVAALFVPRIRAWVTEIVANSGSTDFRYEQNLRQAIELLVKTGNDDDRRFIRETAKQHLGDDITTPIAKVWLPALLNRDPEAGVDTLEKGMAGMTIGKFSPAVQIFADLFNHDHGGLGFDLGSFRFGPVLLLRLLRLAYRQIRPDDDNHHEGSYTPDTRDHAERGRNAILSALFAAHGPEAWTVKIEMANDPLFAHFKDRAIAVADEKAAEEADDVALTEAEFAVLERHGESPPKTRDAMFALMRDRLDDIDDLLLQDVSPRELWASINDEHVMRRALALALRDASRQSYIIDQESVTADEKETDIRFRSTASGQQGVIELKLGDERTGTDLFNTIHDQLLSKYMAADECRAGCLLVTIARHRQWEHPKTGERLSFEQLIAVLNDEAERLANGLGGTVRLMGRGLDLRPRLSKEKATRSGGSVRHTGRC